MKSFSNTYNICLLKEIREKAAKDIRRSKRIRQIMQKEAYTVDSVAADGCNWIENYKNGEHTPLTINDGISKKEKNYFGSNVRRIICSALHC